jgi:hypothetical protein
MGGWVLKDTETITHSYYYVGAQRVAMRDDGTLYYLLSDHLGSTSLTLDASGNKVTEERYKPWGEVRFESGSQKTDYEFTGHLLSLPLFGPPDGHNYPGASYQGKKGQRSFLCPSIGHLRLFSRWLQSV